MLSNKVAVVFHGGMGRSQDQIEGIPADCYHGLNSFNKHIGMKENCDVYSHVWAHSASDNLLSFLNPRAAIITEPYSFDLINLFGLIASNRKRGMKPFLYYLKSIAKDFDNERNRIHSIFSRWFSASLALQLLETTIKKEKCTYKWVILTRYDLEIFSQFDFNTLNPNKVYLGNNVKISDDDGNIIPNRYYWEYKKNKKLNIESVPFISGSRGLEDFFVIGAPQNVIGLCKLHNKIGEIVKAGTKINSHHLLESFLLQQVGIENIEFYKNRILDFDLARRRRLGYVE